MKSSFLITFLLRFRWQGSALVRRHNKDAQVSE
jgi:hypothetical protein